MTFSEHTAAEEPRMDRSQKVKMERFANFMAEMIEKYGSAALEEIEAKKAGKTEQKLIKGYRLFPKPGGLLSLLPLRTEPAALPDL